MARTRTEILASLPADRRQAIEERSAARIEEVIGLSAIRKHAGRSQEFIARVLGVSQPAVAQLERRGDTSLSTLRQYIEAAGGRLDLIVEMPGQKRLRITGFDTPQSSTPVASRPADSSSKRGRHGA